MLIERNRTWSLTYGLRTGEWLIARLGAVFLALPFVLRRHTVGDRVFAAVYFGLAFLIGVCAAAGAGAGAPWFDFAVASCLIVGLAVSDLLAATAHRRYARSLMWVAVVGCLVPVLIGLLRIDLVRLRQYVTLREDNKRLNADVALLRSTAGPALFEIPALGFRAGKEFLFDVFFGSQLIATGRFSERPLIDRIEQGYFQSIVLEDDPADTLRAIDPSGRMASRPRIANDSNGRWTMRTLAAIAKHYEPLNAQGHYFRFYVPRRAGGGSHQ